jgi:hypothetical protein
MENMKMKNVDLENTFLLFQMWGDTIQRSSWFLQEMLEINCKQRCGPLQDPKEMWHAVNL